MITQDIATESVSLTPSTIVSFYVLDLSDIIIEIEEENKRLYFYNGLNNNFEDIVWQGISYIGLPILGENFGYNSQKPVRPTLRLANLNGALTNIIRSYGGIEGATLTRKRTLVKYLDAENFPGGINPYGTPDPDAHFGDDIFIIERKIESNALTLEYELSIPYDLDQTKYPSSQVLANYCQYEYRGEGCRYQGLVMTDIDGNYLSDVSKASAWKVDREYSTSGQCVYDYEGIVLSHYRYKTNTPTVGLKPSENPSHWAYVLAQPWTEPVAYSSGDMAYVIRTGDGRRVYGVCYSNHVSSSPYSGFYNYSLWRHDICGKGISDCNKRFYRILNFGGFRGTSSLSL